MQKLQENIQVATYPVLREGFMLWIWKFHVWGMCRDFMALIVISVKSKYSACWFSPLLPLLPLLFQSCVAQQRKQDDLSKLHWIESEFTTTSGSISIRNSYISPFVLCLHLEFHMSCAFSKDSGSDDDDDDEHSDNDMCIATVY